MQLIKHTPMLGHLQNVVFIVNVKAVPREWSVVAMDLRSIQRPNVCKTSSVDCKQHASVANKETDGTSVRWHQTTWSGDTHTLHNVTQHQTQTQSKHRDCGQHTPCCCMNQPHEKHNTRLKCWWRKFQTITCHWQRVWHKTSWTHCWRDGSQVIVGVQQV